MPDIGRILIADDEDTVRETTAALLEAEGFECDGVPDAQSAMQKMNGQSYDLLITDWKMAGNSNLELVRSLQDSRLGIPIILITGYPQLAEVVRRQHLTVFAQVVKPFEFDDLLRIVREAVHLQRSRGPEGLRPN
jgi:two-component system, NtrC family, response regulator GlrR